MSVISVLEMNLWLGNVLWKSVIPRMSRYVSMCCSVFHSQTLDVQGESKRQKVRERANTSENKRGRASKSQQEKHDKDIMFWKRAIQASLHINVYIYLKSSFPKCNLQAWLWLSNPIFSGIRLIAIGTKKTPLDLHITLEEYP